MKRFFLFCIIFCMSSCYVYYSEQDIKETDSQSVLLEVTHQFSSDKIQPASEKIVTTTCTYRKKVDSYQYSNGIRTLTPLITDTFYTAQNGKILLQLENVVGDSIQIYSFMNQGDTILWEDSMPIRSLSVKTRSATISLEARHTFHPTLSPIHSPIVFGDTLCFTINHDMLTHIKMIVNYNSDREAVNNPAILYEADVNDTLSHTFRMPPIYDYDYNIWSCVFEYTTKNYGTYLSPTYYITLKIE